MYMSLERQLILNQEVTVLLHSNYRAPSYKRDINYRPHTSDFWTLNPKLYIKESANEPVLRIQCDMNCTWMDGHRVV